MPQVTVLTPSYPRYTGDYHGVFIKNLCDNLSKYVSIQVLAPRTRTMKSMTLNYPVKRFPYTPSQRMEYIAEATMKNAPRGVLVCLPLYLSSAYIHTITVRSKLIHTHLAIPLGLVASVNPTKTPQIVTCHGSDITYAIEKPIYRPLTRRVLRKSNSVVTVSNYIKNHAIRLGAPPEKTETIYLGVNTEKFTPRNRHKGITIGTLGRLVSEKNIDELLYAAKFLQKKIDFTLRIGGDGPDQKRLMKIADKLDLDVEFTGRISNPVSFHRSLDVFVLASNREGLSVSLQEAMSCRVVPVTVNDHGCREIIRDNVNGYLYESGNVEMLASRILDAINNREMGLKARETIINHFNDKTATKQYLELYRELGID